MHWDAVDNGRGMSWVDFCGEIHRLPRKQLWRHNQAGDLPGDGDDIDHNALSLLAGSNRGKRGFTYSHYPISARNLIAMRRACFDGFTVNLSCDSVVEADNRFKYGMPMVVILPSTTNVKHLRTPAGRKVIVCPATYREDMTCSNCAICYSSNPKRAIIGFPAHGTRKRVIDIFLEEVK